MRPRPPLLRSPICGHAAARTAHAKFGVRWPPRTTRRTEELDLRVLPKAAGFLSWAHVVWTVDRLSLPLRSIRDFVTLDFVSKRDLMLVSKSVQARVAVLRAPQQSQCCALRRSSERAALFAVHLARLRRAWCPWCPLPRLIFWVRLILCERCSIRGSPPRALLAGPQFSAATRTRTRTVFL